MQGGKWRCTFPIPENKTDTTDTLFIRSILPQPLATRGDKRAKGKNRLAVVHGRQGSIDPNQQKSKHPRSGVKGQRDSVHGPQVAPHSTTKIKTESECLGEVGVFLEIKFKSNLNTVSIGYYRSRSYKSRPGFYFYRPAEHEELIWSRLLQLSEDSFRAIKPREASGETQMA